LTLRDIHSYAEPERALVRHAKLDLEVFFDQRTIAGTVILSVETYGPDNRELVLDSRALNVESAQISLGGTTFEATTFESGVPDPILGSRLAIRIQPTTRFVRIAYSTSPQASALQWLDPAQTAGGRHPFLYTQSQAIHARSWIPLQDSPGIRITYEARVRVPTGLTAVMSAARTSEQASPEAAPSRAAPPEPTVTTFSMPQPIPAYLIALAVGDIAFAPLGSRTGVWAEPPILEAAAWEFADMEKMLEAAEDLYGAYRWDRYDLIVLPPSFPFGGMENPRMTFATPTILAGDRSLVSLVAHELAHSWSGNLVTNATWSDFWLNEGFTVYIERRILEHIYGTVRAEMEAALGYEELARELAEHPPADQILHIDLAGRDPDDGVTQIPYEKGALFLRQLEAAFGRERFDKYVRAYFDRFAFQSITTAEALAFLREQLLSPDPALASRIPLDAWIFQPGLPASAIVHRSPALEAAERSADRWSHGAGPQTVSWSTQEWLAFLRKLPARLSAEQMKRLDATCRLTSARNSEILAQWLLMAVRNGYEPAFARLEEFLTTVGRRKYIKPLYEAMNRDYATRIYRIARPLYHPITQATIDGILGVR
jgi:aminopeptidase N